MRREMRPSALCVLRPCTSVVRPQLRSKAREREIIIKVPVCFARRVMTWGERGGPRGLLFRAPNADQDATSDVIGTVK
jgi:hypothetical protein